MNDLLIQWLREQAVDYLHGSGSGMWDAGWFSAILDVIERVPDFPDPPPRWETPKSVSHEEHAKMWKEHKQSMDEWVRRNTADTEGKP